MCKRRLTTHAVFVVTVMDRLIDRLGFPAEIHKTIAACGVGLNGRPAQDEKTPGGEPKDIS